MRRGSLRGLRLVIALSLATSTAYAAGTDPGQATPVQREQAQSRFLKGRQLYDAGDYAGAVTEFRASHDIVASPNARLYLARALREKKDLVAAYVEFDRTRVESKELARDDTRYEKAGVVAQTERDALAKKLGFVTLQINNATDETTLKIAGDPIQRAGWSEPAPVMPGTTAIVVETPGRKPVEDSVTLDAGQKTSKVIDAASGGPIAPAPAPVAQPAPEPASDKTKLRPYAYVAGGIGALGLITFAVAGSMSNSTYSDLESTCGGARSCANAQAHDDISRGKTQQTIANIGLVVGVIGVAAGVTLFVISRGDSKSNARASAHAEFVVGPSSGVIRGTF
jgi:hypothetical protein